MKGLFFNLGWAKILVLAAVVSLSSCKSKEGDEVEVDTTYQDMEQELFDQYMEWYKKGKDLIQSDNGKYYYKIKSSGSGVATNEDLCWVRYDITSRNLTGDSYNGVNLTTNEDIALNQQSFSYYTHYVPMLHTLDAANSNDSALDITMRDYAIYGGDDVSIYAPSALSYGLVNGSGYGGSATLSKGESFFSDIKITEVISDIAEWELELIKNFKTNTPPFTQAKDKEETEIDVYYLNNNNANDVTLDFLNNLPIDYPYTYLKDRRGVTDLDAKIKSLLQKFTEEEIAEAIENGAETESGDDTKLALPETTIGVSDDAKIWYVGRFLDGFIFDSNIKSISGFMFGDYSYSSSLIYNATNNADMMIESFSHTIPNFKYGTWNVILTSSEYAYGADGKTGSMSNTNIKPYTPLIFYIYVEPNIE